MFSPISSLFHKSTRPESQAWQFFSDLFLLYVLADRTPPKKGESNNYKANTIKDIYLSQNLPSNRLLWPRYPTAIHTRSARPGTPPVAPLGESGNLRTGPPPRWLDTPSLGVIHGRWVWKIGAQPVMAGGWCMDGPEETDAAAW